MDYELETKEALFRITLKEKLYELYPYSNIGVYTSDVTDTVNLEMFFFWKGKRLGIRYAVSFITIKDYELNELIGISILNIQREITDHILREGADNDTSTKES